MLSFSRTTGYAILALSCIGSWKGQRVLSGQIHRCTGIPMPYLRKTLFALGRFGLIQAKRGYQGGFVLGRPPERITLLDVVQAVEHGKSASDCVFGLPGCSGPTFCPLRGAWHRMWAQLEAELRKVTVAQAAEKIRAARWGQLMTCPSPEVTKRRQGSSKKAKASDGPAVGTKRPAKLAGAVRRRSVTHGGDQDDEGAEAPLRPRKRTQGGVTRFRQASRSRQKLSR